MKKKEDLLQALISDADKFSSETIQKKAENEMFELWLDPVLSSNLSGNLGAFLVRALLNKLNINEHHLSRWKLENKYWQYQVLNYFVPGCMAQTISISQLLNEDNGVQKVRTLCEDGFFVKETLGDGSGRGNSFDKTGELDEIIRLQQNGEDKEEKWILQKRLTLIKEFRIHTFDRDLLPGLTFIIKGQDYSNSIEAESFVESILEKLPDLILQDALIGWDIGITDTEEYFVIETNITGFHHEFKPGFQTSGYFGDRTYGAIICAWLNNYFRTKYHVSIGSVESYLFSTDIFYENFLFYSSIFRDEHLEILKRKTKSTPISAVIYFGKDIDPLLVNFVNYMLVTNWASIFYLIVDKGSLLAVGNLFPKLDFIQVIAEDVLFSKDQYLLIKELNKEERRKSCFQHVMRIMKDDPCFMI